jgi:hypothetical protein
MSFLSASLQRIDSNGIPRPVQETIKLQTLRFCLVAQIKALQVVAIRYTIATPQGVSGLGVCDIRHRCAMIDAAAHPRS